MLKKMKKRAAAVSALCGFFCCLSLTSADILSDSLREDPVGIRRLEPSARIADDVKRLSFFVKAFNPRIFSGKATRPDAERFMAALEKDVDSSQLLGIIVTVARVNPELSDYLFDSIAKLADSNPDSPYVNVITGERLFPDESRHGDVLKYLSNSFRVLSSRRSLPKNGSFARTAMNSAFTKLVALYSSKGMDDDEKMLIEYMRSNPEFASDPVLARDMLVCRHIALTSYKKPPSVLGMPPVDATYILRAKLDAQIDEYLAALSKKGSGVIADPAALEVIEKAGRLSEVVEPLYGRLMSASDDVETAGTLAVVSMRLKRFREAARLFRAALTLAPREHPEMYIDYAFALRRCGEYDEAMSAYAVAVRLMPASASETARLMLELLIESEQYMRALERIQRLPGERDDFEKMYITILCFYKLGDYKRAHAETLRTATAISARKDITLADAFWIMCGMAADKANDMAFIEKYIEPLLAVPKTGAEMLNFVGYIYADHGFKLKEAQSYIEKALAADPESYAVIDSMAWVLYRRGAFVEAKKYILDAIAHSEKANTLDSLLCDHAGDIMLANGDLVQARSFWMRALDLPGEADYASIRAKIEKLDAKAAETEK